MEKCVQLDDVFGRKVIRTKKQMIIRDQPTRALLLGNLVMPERETDMNKILLDISKVELKMIIKPLNS